MAYRLTRKAAEDVGRIYLDSVQQFGLKQADAYHDLLTNAFHFLAANPRAARSRPELTAETRIHPVKSHIVIYRIEPSGDILVMRVRHGHEDWANDAHG